MVERTKFHSAFVINIQFTSNYLKISIYSQISVRLPLIHYKPLRMRKPETNFHFHYTAFHMDTQNVHDLFLAVFYIFRLIFGIPPPLFMYEQQSV